jgi:hypothetical protein
MSREHDFWLAIIAGAPALTTGLQKKLRLVECDNWHTRFAEESQSLPYSDSQ